MNAIYIRNLKPENIKEGVEILKVKGTYQGGGPAEPVNEDITIDPSTVQQQVTAGEGYTGLGTVTVNPYVLDSKTVDPSTSAFTVNSSVDGLSSVTLNPVTASIDVNIAAGNIKQGVSILGVTGILDPSVDWILEAKSVANASVSTDTDGLCNASYGMQYLFENSNLSTINFTNTTVSGDYAFDHAFVGCSNATSINFSNLTSITGQYAFNRAFQNLNCDITFPELRSISGNHGLFECNYGRNTGRIYFPKLESITGNGALQQIYDYGSASVNRVPYEFPELRTINGDDALCNLFIAGRGNISSVSFPKLESIRGANAFAGFLANNSYCTTLSMPRLLYKEDNTTFKWFWNGSYQSTITTTPEFFKYNSSSDYSCNIYARNITLVIPNDYTYLGGWNPSSTHLNFNNSWVDNLSDANILHILQQLGNVSDYDQVHYMVNFTSKTIQDTSDFDYTLAINKLEDAGWTINGLTITVPSFITINSGSNLNLYNGDEINFDALYSWTASVDDPSIHLSSASGSSGSGNVITVTMDAGWNSDATVTLSCSNGVITETETVHVFYSDANYTRLQYVRTSSSCPSVPLGVQIGPNDDAVLSFKARSNNGKTMFGYTAGSNDYDLYTWRIFYYMSYIYWDAGGEVEGQGRMDVGGSSFNYDTNAVRTILFKRSNNDFMIKNLDTLDTYSQVRSTTFTGTPSVIGLGDVTGNTGVQDCDFYEFTVYPNGYQDGAGTPSAHYVAALDSNDVACIVDTISNVFYYPTSGALIPGPEY